MHEALFWASSLFPTFQAPERSPHRTSPPSCGGFLVRTMNQCLKPLCFENSNMHSILIHHALGQQCILANNRTRSDQHSLTYFWT
eukprot:2700725-Amphidinium_carterae.1